MQINEDVVKYIRSDEQVRDLISHLVEGDDRWLYYQVHVRLIENSFGVMYSDRDREEIYNGQDANNALEIVEELKKRGIFSTMHGADTTLCHIGISGELKLNIGTGFKVTFTPNIEARKNLRQIINSV